MPKKTRQEKLLAQLKRIQKQQNPVVQTTSTNSQNPTQGVVSLNLKSLETSNNTPVSSQKSVLHDYTYVYTDLRKTLIFAALAVIFEFALSRFV